MPESLGGERNWGYRSSWVRDSAFTLDALQRLGELNEARAHFWWLLHASRLTHPRLQALYRLDGGARAVKHTLPLMGYQHYPPVRVGNGAADQVQLDIYGELTRWRASLGRLQAFTTETRAAGPCPLQSEEPCWLGLQAGAQRQQSLYERGEIDIQGGRWRRGCGISRILSITLTRARSRLCMDRPCRDPRASGSSERLLLPALHPR